MRQIKFVLTSLLVLLWVNQSIAQSWADLTKQGITAYQNHDYSGALTYYTKAYDVIVKEEGKKGAKYCATLNNLGQAFRELGDFKKSRLFFEDALKSREKEFGKNNMEYIIVLGNFGTLCRLEGKLDESYKVNKEALDLAKSLFGKEHPNTALCYNNMGRICMEMSKYDEAEQHYLKAAEIIKLSIGESNPKYTTCLNNLAMVYQRKGEFDKSEELFIKMMELRKQSAGENSVDYAVAAQNLGSFYNAIGDYEKAETYLLISLSILKIKVDPSDVAYISNLSSLGANYVNLNNFPMARKCLLEAFSIAKEYHSHQAELYPNILHNLGITFLKMDSLPQAEECLLNALKLQKDIYGDNNLTYANELHSLGNVYFKQLRLDDAENSYNAAISIYEKLFGKDYGQMAFVLDGLAGVLRGKGKMKDAQKLSERSVALFEKQFGESHPEYVNSLLNLMGSYIQNGDLKEAAQVYRKVLPLYRDFFIRSAAFLSAGELNQLMFVEKGKLSALESYERILAPSNPDLIKVMFDFRLMMDGLQLRNSIRVRSSVLGSGDSTLSKDYKEWMNLTFKISYQLTLPIADRSPELSGWELRAFDLEKKLVKGSKLFGKEQSLTDISSHSINKQLVSNEALVKFISYRWYNNRTWTDSIMYGALIFRKQDSIPVYLELFEQNQMKGLLLGDTLRTFPNLLYSNSQIRNVPHNKSYGDSLYQLIWKPIIPYLDGITSVHYISTGILHKLSMDAIPVNENTCMSDNLHLNRLITAHSLKERSEVTGTFNHAVMFGGIEYDMDTTEWRNVVGSNHTYPLNSSSFDLSRGNRWGRWSYLPGSRKEIDVLKDLFERSNISLTRFDGKMATEESFKQLHNKAFDILHISTHGYYFPGDNINIVKTASINSTGGLIGSDDPLLRSGLIFSGANYVWEGHKPLVGIDDGIVTAMDISGMYLPKTKLVVMSACETGLGDIGGNEGVYGLQRAFKMSGAEYMLVTLWPVLDKETSEFMIMFYEDLIKLSSIPDAFRSTQNKMKAKYLDEPYKWAGFVLIH